MVAGTVYIAHDIETSGPNTKKHEMLSVGACVVTTKFFTRDELEERGLCFYRELKPRLEHRGRFEFEAMKIACLGLDSLFPSPRSSCFRLHNEHFDPQQAMDLLSRFGVPPDTAMVAFLTWVKQMVGENNFMPVFDTTLFDSVFLKRYLDEFTDDPNCPYSHRGADISWFWRGKANREHARLSELDVVTADLQEHNALDDAIRLARQARELGLCSAGYE